MGDLRLFLLLMLHKIILARLIQEDAPYEKILEESKINDSIENIYYKKIRETYLSKKHLL